MFRSKIILFVFLVTGLLLAACGGSGNVVVKQADPETRELVIQAWGKLGDTTSITVISTDDEKSTAWAGSVYWYYDVPEDQVEYLVISDSIFYLHLHENKNPQP